VRVGVFSLYFPSMLKPVPIRLRAGLWMVANNRENIPPLPAEGRTSMDLPQGVPRDFYATIGYLPLGDHAIRADMVERLAAMARHAVRESREAARRAPPPPQQQQKTPDAAPTEGAAAAAAPSTDEISEWAIVAAAFGESEPTSAAPVAEVAAEEAAATPVEAVSEPVQAEDVAAEPPPVEEAKIEETKAEETTAEEAPVEAAPEEISAESPAPAAGEGKPDEAKKTGPRPLPPGWFRATPQMMSLVGCSEPEMANVLRGLGYRVHPPSEEHGPLYAFSVKPRFVREREEQRERQRQQQRQQRDQQRRQRPERPNERQFFADSPRPERSKDERRRDGPPNNPPSKERRDDRPPPSANSREDRPREDRRGPRPPRRDSGGPALRLYATTEKKGDASDSPFAKLLELKLGGKK
jgi:ATP-dependent RNA helicase SUPV3L1/SUV3